MTQPMLIKRLTRRILKILGADTRHRLYHIKSPIQQDRFYIGPNGEQLYASGFNMAWFDELGIEPMVIIDVGSYDGGDALTFKQHSPASTVVTVEADPDRARFAREALDGTGIEVIETAISDRAGELSFYRTSIEGTPSSQGSLFKLSHKARKELSHIDQADQPITVQSQRLDDILSKRRLGTPDLLHMDIQGGEYDALVGLGSVRPKVIYLEVDTHYDGAKRARHIHRLMRRMGYTIAADLVTDRLYVRSDLLSKPSPMPSSA